MPTAYILNPGHKGRKKKVKGNPTPLMIISNPKKRKKTLNNGGTKMAKKKAKKASKVKKHRSVAVNPKKRRAAKKTTKHVYHAKHKVSVNPKKRRESHKAKELIVNRRKRQYSKNPDTMESIGEYGKQLGLGLTSAVATVMLPSLVFNAIDPKLNQNKIALYGGQAAVVAGLGLITHHVLKAKDWAAPLVFGGSMIIGLEILSDLFSSINNYVKISGYKRVSGYGQLVAPGQPLALPNNNNVRPSYTTRQAIYA